MSRISDLYSDIYEYHDEKAINTYAEIVSSGNTDRKKTADTPAPSVIDETSSAVTDTKNNTDSTENPFMALLRKANDNQIAVCVSSEPETVSSDNIDRMENAGNPVFKALLQKAKDNQIEVCAEPEPESKPEKRPFNLAKAIKEDKIRESMPSIIAGLELLRQNELKAYQPVNVDMKMAERQSHHYKLSENAKEFCRFISATPEYANSCKQIHSHNKKKDIVKLLNFFKQNDEGNSFEFIHTTRFYRHLDYYVTKNSFFADKHKAENLFSFDNIVIDVDNHDEPALTTRELNKEIGKLLSCLRAEERNFPEFSVVYSGRGVHIWIRLESFSAIPETMKRLYDTICRKLCDIVEKVIKENGINLEVDIPATVDTTRLVRLPYTWNTKANRKATFEKLTDRRYGLTELCERFEIPRKKDKSEDKNQDDNDKKQIYWSDNTRLPYKRSSFIVELSKMNNGYCKGRRNSMLYIYYNYCLQLYDINTAQIKLQQLNNSFKEPVKQSQINGIFREFEKKAQTKQPFYKYFKATFLGDLKLTPNEVLAYENFMSRDAQRKEAREVKENRNQMIQELSEQGLNVDEIAKKVGCSAKTVLRLVKPLKADIKDSILDLYKQGKKQKEIAKKLGIAESTVSDILKPLKKKEISPRDRKIIDLSQQGYTQQQIADTVGCSRRTVINVLNACKSDNAVIPAAVPTVEESNQDKSVILLSEQEEDVPPTPEDFDEIMEILHKADYERMLNTYPEYELERYGLP